MKFNTNFIECKHTLLFLRPFLMTEVISSAKFINENSQFVKLGNDESFRKAAEVIEPLVKNWKPGNWSESNLQPQGITKYDKATWIFFIDTVNFGFWTVPGQPYFTVNYKDKNYTGYFSLVAGIRKALDNGDKRILDVNFWEQCNAEDLKSIFKSEITSEIPLVDFRVKVLNEAGKFIKENYNGSVYEMIKSVNNSAVKLVNLVSNNLMSYNDKYEFKGRKVSFLKRAQILAADLHFGFLGDGDDVCKFNDIDQLTMFADYRVPQVLNYFGLLIYSDELLKELKERPHFEPGSTMECEIRGNSILCVEKLKSFMKEKHPSTLIDFVLWDYAKANSEKMEHIPIHKTRSVFY